MRAGSCLVVLAASLLACEQSASSFAASARKPPPPSDPVAPSPPPAPPPLLLVGGSPASADCRPRQIPSIPVSAIDAPLVPCRGGACAEDYPSGWAASASVAPGGDIWVVGSTLGGDSMVVRRHGATWSALCPPDAAALEKVVAVGDTDVWAFARARSDDAEQSGPSLLHWDGHEWSRLSAGTIRLLASDGTKLLVLDGATSHAWSWDGSGWQDEYQLGSAMYDPQAVRRGDTLVVMERYANGPLYLRTAGAWRAIPLAQETTAGAWLNAVAIDGAGRVWAGGGVDAYYGLLYRWDGAGVERLDWARASPAIGSLGVAGQDLVVVTTELDPSAGLRLVSEDGEPRPTAPVPLRGGYVADFVSSGGETFAVLSESIQRLSSAGWEEELGWANVQSIAGTGTRDVWAGGRDLWHLDGDGWTRVASAPAADPPKPFAPPVFGALVAGAPGEVWASSSGSILHWNAGAAESIASPGADLAVIAAAQGVLWGAAGSTLWRHDAGGWRAVDTGYPGPSVTLGDGEITGLAAVSADEVWASAYVEPPGGWRFAPEDPALLHVAGGAVERLDATAYVAGVAQGPAGVFAFGSYRPCYGAVDAGGLFRVAAGALERIAGPSFAQLTPAPDGALLGLVHGPAVAGSTDAPPGLYRLAPGADPASGWTRIAPEVGYRLWADPDDGSVWATPGLWRTRAGTP